MCPDEFAQYHCVVYGGVEGLMAAALNVANVFADDPPVVNLEDFVSQQLVGVAQTIENKSD
jgi:hypothetical protein